MRTCNHQARPMIAFTICSVCGTPMTVDELGNAVCPKCDDPNHRPRVPNLNVAQVPGRRALRVVPDFRVRLTGPV